MSSKQEEIKKMHLKAKADIAFIKGSFQDKVNRMINSMWEVSSGLLDYVSRKEKAANEKHARALTKLSPIRAEAAKLSAEAKELEDMTFDFE